MIKNVFSVTKNVCFWGCLFILLSALVSCAKEKKREEMTLDELSQKVSFFMNKKKNDDAITYLEEIVGRFPDHHNISKFKMTLADLYFKEGKYAAAQEVYEHLNQFYPADTGAEHWKYQSILSMFNQSLNADCDQTETEETVRLCQEYIQNAAYKKYRKEIIDIQNKCESKLIDKEIYVFNFYIKQGNYDAAQKRLKYLQEKYLSTNPVLEARLLYLECKLAQREKNKVKVRQNIDKLLEKYPDSNFTQMAQALTTKSTFLF